MTRHVVQGQEDILILGPSKTGTTGVYTAVQEGLVNAGIPARTIFEPPSSGLIDSMFRLAPSTTLMTKVTMERINDVVPDIRVFDRRVMTVRDPRDIIVSSLLFRPLTRSSIDRAQSSAVQEFIVALEEKEGDPSSHSVLDLFAIAYRLGIGRRPFRALLQDLDHQRELLATGLVHVLSYERFVQGEMDDLSDYLGFETKQAAGRKGIGHIVRSKSSGDFTRWFLEKDLDYFNELYGDHLRTFGYDLDVTLDLDAKIDTATSSQYVQRGYADRRAAMALERPVLWAPEDVDTFEALRQIIDIARDGGRAPCLRAAKVLLNGHLGSKDPVGALDWARFAAQMGSAEGRELTIDILLLLDPDDPALRRELRMWQVESQLADERDQRSTKSVARRLGSVLGYMLRNPRKGLRKVVSRLRRGLAASLRR